LCPGLGCNASIGLARSFRAILSLALASALQLTPAAAQTLRTYVSGAGKDTNPCTFSAPCQTLQAALKLTAPGGEIQSLDSADYGYATIAQSVTIIGAHGVAGVLATNVSGITINAGANDVINLRGLDIDGAGTGVNGILFSSGAALNVDDSVIRGFTNGVTISSTNPNSFSISNTLISNNSTGVSIQSAAPSTGVLAGTQVTNNATGLIATGVSAAVQATLTVQNSVVTSNSTVGLASNGFSMISVSGSMIANNGVGVEAQNSGAVLRLATSYASGNSTGSTAAAGGQVISANDHLIAGNTGGGSTPPAPVPPPTPDPKPAPTPDPTPAPTVVKNIVKDFRATCNGTGNDNAAFTAFNSWAKQWQTNNPGQIELDIPSGSVCMFTSNSMGNWFARGIKNLLVVGYGATLSDNNGTGNGFFLGGFGVVADNVHSARLATVAAGSNTVTLLNPRQASVFRVGSWALISGLDMMGYGYPPNPAFFEYVQITAIDSGTGAIAFSAPLRNGYKSTWPLYNAGNAFEADQGGPATLYALDPSWDTQVEYRGLTLSQAGQTYANGRSVTFRDVTFTGAACGVPSQNMLWQAINTDMSNCGMEVDKLIDTLVLSGVTIRMVAFQSASVNSFSMDGSNVTRALNGTAITSNISNSTIASFMPGAYAYGASQRTTCTNCVLNEIVTGGFSEKDINDYSMANGILTIPNSHGPVTWAVPGANIAWTGHYDFEGPVMQIKDVTQDTNNTYVITSMNGGFPALQLGNSPHIGVRTHPAPQFTCTNCTGSADALDLSGAPPGVPLWSYSSRTYTSASAAALVPVWGQLVSIKVVPMIAYAGSFPIRFSFDDPFIALVNTTSTPRWTPAINPQIAGERDLSPTTISGAQLGDSLTPPGPGTWILSDQITPKFNSHPSDIGSTSVTVTIQTDQGVVNP
jgi:hypothetical protein